MFSHPPCSAHNLNVCFHEVVDSNMPWKSHVVFTELELRTFSADAQGLLPFNLGLPHFKVGKCIGYLLYSCAGS